jgi:hypothetical protein
VRREYRCSYGETFEYDDEASPVYYDTNAPLAIAVGAVVFLLVIIVGALNIAAAS